MAGTSAGPGIDVGAVFHDLVRLEIELWDAVDRRLRETVDVPLAWLLPLQVVARTDACRVNDIAADIGTTVGGTSKLVDRLEDAGYVRRRANPSDRRSSVIELTARGRQRVAEAEAVLDAELTLRLGQALPARTLAQFATTLRTLRRSGAATTERTD